MLFVRRFIVIFVAAAALAAVAAVVMIIVPLLPFVCAILELMIFQCFGFEISGTVCMLFVRCFGSLLLLLLLLLMLL